MLLLFSGRTKGYLDAFEKVNEHFVKTKLTAKCCSKLEKEGILVLIGKPGCGKTTTAIHLMTNTDLRKWKKMKITENELLQVEPEDNTIIYIDDLFAGFRYEHCLFDWWNSLFEFYSRYIKEERKVRLIITAEHTVMEKACVFIDKNIETKAHSFIVKANLHERTTDEKLEILKSQFKLASEMKKVERIFLETTLRDHIPEGKGSIGFPLCAFLYSFEERKEERERSIFVEPRSYVRKYINNEIQKDEDTTAKTLFLIFLFYMHLGPARSISSEFLDKLDKQKFVEFLKETCPEVVLDDFEPLSFSYLKEKAERFENEFLVKVNEMYEFRHQIYLNGIADYFFQRHFDSVVHHFPFAILRTCELLYDISQEDLNKLLERLKKEIQNRRFFLVLSCNIFQNPSFEQTFCDLHSNEPFLNNLLTTLDESSVFKFPIIFWACKYKLKKLVSVLLNLVDENESNGNLQFYIAMLGECCAVDENYIKCALKPPKIGEVRKSVFNFKTTDGETILHLLLSSDKSDADAYRCLTKLLEDPEKRTLVLDHSLLDTALGQLRYSRLKCLREIIMKQTVKGKPDNQYIATLVNASHHCKSKILELECLCRIGILVIHGVDDFSKETKTAFFGNMNIDFQGCIGPSKDRLKISIANRIDKCLEEFSNLHSRKESSGSLFEECYNTAVDILSERDQQLDVNDVQ